MAVAKIHAIKSNLKKAIDYIINDEKTILPDGTRLVSSFGCATETAAIEFNLTANLAKEIKGDYSKTGGANNLAYHMIQSFAIPDNEKVTPKQIHELGKKFADEFLQGKYEYVISTHIDKGHIHNHIIFNSTSFKDHKKFRSEPYKTVAKIREISDKICEENGLSVIKTKGIGRTYKEWEVTKNGEITWKDTIKNKIDELIPKVSSYKEFVSQMEAAGFTVKEGKHITFKAAGQERFVRGKRIGEDYTKLRIIERIASEKEKNIEKDTHIIIDKKFIFKTLTDGFILNVPNQNYLVYLNGETAKLDDNNVIASLTEKEYSIFNRGLTSAGKISVDKLLAAYSDTMQPDKHNVDQNENGEIPLSEYLNLRRNERKENLHKVAQAIVYSRSEGVIYYSDYDKRISELKDKSYETRNTLIQLDDKISKIKNIGRLIVTYNKYLPIKQGLDNLKFAKFTRKKYENNHKTDLASFNYAVDQLKELGIDQEKTSATDLITQIKDNEKVIKDIEQRANNIFERIEKLTNCQNIVDSFINGRDETLQMQKYIVNATPQNKKSLKQQKEEAQEKANWQNAHFDNKPAQNKEKGQDR